MKLVKDAIKCMDEYFWELLLVLLFFVLFAGWAGQIATELRNSVASYVGFALFGLIATLRIWRTKSYSSLQLSNWDVMPLSFMIIWLYGAVVGLIKGTDPILVLRTFFGFWVYSFYFFLLLSRMTKPRLANTLIAIGLCASALIVLILFDRYPLHYTFDRLIHSRVLFTPIQFVPLALLPLFVCAVLSKRLRRQLPVPFNFLPAALFAVIVIGFVSVFVPKSKGILLSLVSMIGLVVIARFSRFTIPLVIGGFAALVFTHFYPGSYFDPAYRIIISIIDPNNLANFERYRQGYFLVSDTNLIGRGLGAATSNFYIRDPIFVYSYEHSLLNLAHKFGLLSVILFACYFISFRSILKHLVAKADMKVVLIALGCMNFFFIGIGNPFLFSPESAIFHCIALYLLRPEAAPPTHATRAIGV